MPQTILSMTWFSFSASCSVLSGQGSICANFVFSFYTPAVTQESFLLRYINHYSSEGTSESGDAYKNLLPYRLRRHVIGLASQPQGSIYDEFFLSYVSPRHGQSLCLRTFQSSVKLSKYHKSTCVWTDCQSSVKHPQTCRNWMFCLIIQSVKDVALLRVLLLMFQWCDSSAQFEWKEEFESILFLCSHYQGLLMWLDEIDKVQVSSEWARVDLLWCCNLFNDSLSFLPCVHSR